MARVHGQPVIVFVDRIRAEREQQQLPPNSELHLYRREVGKLVLYELSPLDRPYVLDSFYIPDKPASWYQP